MGQFQKLHMHVIPAVQWEGQWLGLEAARLTIVLHTPAHRRYYDTI